MKIAILKENGYEYIESINMNYRKSKSVRKIFAFRKILNEQSGT